MAAAHFPTYEKLIRKLEEQVEAAVPAKRRLSWRRASQPDPRQTALLDVARFLELVTSHIKDVTDYELFDAWWNEQATDTERGTRTHDFGNNKKLVPVLSHMNDMSQGVKERTGDPEGLKGFVNECLEAFKNYFDRAGLVHRGGAANEQGRRGLGRFFTSRELASHVRMTRRAENIYGVTANELRGRYL